MLNVIIATFLLFTTVPAPITSRLESQVVEIGGQENIYLNMEEKFELLVADTLKKQAKERADATKVVEHAIIPKDREQLGESFPALVSATFRLETGNGTSALWESHNNAGGIKCGSEYCYYNSQAEGLQALERLLIRYIENYGFNLKAIRDVWSESDDTVKFTQIYNEELNKGG